MKRTFQERVDRFQVNLITTALKKHGTKTKAALSLGMSKQALWARMTSLGLEKPGTGRKPLPV